MRFIAILTFLAFTSFDAGAERQWTSLDFDVTLPEPYGETSVSVRTNEDVEDLRIVSITLNFEKWILECPPALFADLDHLWLNSFSVSPAVTRIPTSEIWIQIEFGLEYLPELEELPYARLRLLDGKFVGRYRWLKKGEKWEYVSETP